MANEKRLDLIDRGAALEELCEYCIVGIEGKCPEGGCAEFQHILELLPCLWGENGRGC